MPDPNTTTEPAPRAEPASNDTASHADEKSNDTAPTADAASIEPVRDADETITILAPSDNAAGVTQALPSPEGTPAGAHAALSPGGASAPAAAETGSFALGARDCIPTLLGYLSIGFAAGVLEKTAGMSIAEIALISLLLYAGSAQFIVAGMVGAGSPLFSILFTVLFVNLRHLLLSTAISPHFREYSPWKNLLVGAQLTDETFGVAINRLTSPMMHRDKWMYGLNVTAHVNWIAANIVGGFLGARIPDPQRFGLDFALPAMFVGLLVLQMASRKKIAVDLGVAAASIAIFVIICYVFSGSLGVILATLAAAVIGMGLEKWK